MHERPSRCLPWLLLGILLGSLLTGCPARMSDEEKFTRDGNTYFENGNFEKARDAFDQALQIDPGTPGLLVSRGNARMMLEDHAGALADYDAALEADPQFALAYANRGILRDRMEDREGALADYRRALELDPELGEGPSIWKRIISDPPTETIRDRLLYLQSLDTARSAAGEEDKRP